MCFNTLNENLWREQKSGIYGNQMPRNAIYKTNAVELDDILILNFLQ